jgi:thymidylate synthase
VRVITTRNVQQALPQAVRLLEEEGISRNSRNGPVLVAPWPVTTVYERPEERVLFWPQRDANPALHLYESLWMLAGREDLAPLLNYAKQFAEYSDDGLALWGAYGYRWREMFHCDQLSVIAMELRKNHDDRRCVIQMWDTRLDLARLGRDVPCNVMATVQISGTGALDLTVFNRSNDIVWGCYGANAVHFSFLQEYLALLVGVPMGRYTQVSVNWHAYLNTFEQVRKIPHGGGRLWDPNWTENDPYEQRLVRHLSMRCLEDEITANSVIDHLLAEEARGFDRPYEPYDRWDDLVYRVLHAHRLWRTLPTPERYTRALAEMEVNSIQGWDWTLAMREWLTRRYTKWQEKQS